jgi:homoaconitase/3-isopropylmalate dehydratase large subunit
MSHPQSRIPGKTIAENILSAKSSSDARAGDVVVSTLDHLVATGGLMPMTIDYFERMGGGGHSILCRPNDMNEILL